MKSKRVIAQKNHREALEVLKAHGYSLNKPPPTEDEMLTDYYHRAQQTLAVISQPEPEKKQKKRNRNHRKKDRKKSDWKVKSDAFFRSKAWRSIRYAALRNSDGACNLCGATKHDGTRLHVDHILPRSKYPHLALDLGNLQVLCEDCNFGKSNIYEDDWRAKM